jgi:tetratricopeptide (TPR) repeat protein
VIFPGLGFGLVAALALPGLLLAWREFRLSRWIAIAIALQMLALLGVFVTERYRLPAVPGLLLFAGFGLWQLWCALLCTNYRQSFAYSACLIASVWLVSQPERDSSLWALDNYNTGLQALDSNQLDLAQRKLERAYAYVPENAEINFALGNLHLARADASGARKFYSASLYLDPKHTGALNNLGVLALKEERWDAASAYFRKAIEQEPDEANTHYLLAESLLRMGERDSARSEVGKAIVLKPNQSEFLKLREEIR